MLLKLKTKIFYFIILMIIQKSLQQNKPALKIQLNPPEQTSKDTKIALEDLSRLENEIRIGMNEDFEDEKKRVIELQKARIHDIVHGAFITLQALIPNPIKSAIQENVREKINGENGNNNINFNTKNSQNSVDNSGIDKDIFNLKKNIESYSSFKQIQANKSNLRKTNFNNIME